MRLISAMLLISWQDFEVWHQLFLLADPRGKRNFGIRSVKIAHKHDLVHRAVLDIWPVAGNCELFSCLTFCLNMPVKIQILSVCFVDFISYFILQASSIALL